MSPDQPASPATYARRLGLFSGTMAVIGGIIGGGIFRTPATVAERVGSPGLILGAWIAGGAVALVGALCFGELGQRRPKAGGGYVYLRETWGPLAAFLYGWALLLVIATGAMAAVAVTFASYALALAGLLRLDFDRRFKFGLLAAALCLGLMGFALNRCIRDRICIRAPTPGSARRRVAPQSSLAPALRLSTAVLCGFGEDPQTCRRRATFRLGQTRTDRRRQLSAL